MARARLVPAGSGRRRVSCLGSSTRSSGAETRLQASPRSGRQALSDPAALRAGDAWRGDVGVAGSRRTSSQRTADLFRITLASRRAAAARHLPVPGQLDERAHAPASSSANRSPTVLVALLGEFGGVDDIVERVRRRVLPAGALGDEADDRLGELVGERLRLRRARSLPPSARSRRLRRGLRREVILSPSMSRNWLDGSTPRVPCDRGHPTRRDRCRAAGGSLPGAGAPHRPRGHPPPGCGPLR